MFYKKCDNNWVVRIELGEEITSTLISFCNEHNIRAAEVSGIGAASHAVVGVFDTEKKQYNKSEYNNFAEIVSLMGSVTYMNGSAYTHLHASFASEGCNIYGGHLLECTCGLTAEIFIRPVCDEIGRFFFPVTGTNLLDLPESEKYE